MLLSRLVARKAVCLSIRFFIGIGIYVVYVMFFIQKYIKFEDGSSGWAALTRKTNSRFEYQSIADDAEAIAQV